MTAPSAARRRPWILAGALGLAFAGGLALAPLAIAAEVEAAHAGAPSMQGQMMAHVEHMLDEIGATADQKSRIKTILRGAMEPIAHSDMAAHHKAALAILTAPTIDRGTIEEMRAEHVAQIDAESRKLATAIADAAEVLTPDQRVKLAMMAQREHMTARVQ